jgi:hypothetical protein
VSPTTRVLLVEFTAYNLNLNIFLTMQIGCEIPASGELIPFSNVNTVKALRYETGTDFALLALEILIVIYFFIEYIYLEIYEVGIYR